MVIDVSMRKEEKKEQESRRKVSETPGKNEKNSRNGREERQGTNSL